MILLKALAIDASIPVMSNSMDYSEDLLISILRFFKKSASLNGN
jgi:hypothetical protein